MASCSALDADGACSRGESESRVWWWTLLVLLDPASNRPYLSTPPNPEYPLWPKIHPSGEDDERDNVFDIKDDVDGGDEGDVPESFCRSADSDKGDQAPLHQIKCVHCQ